MVALSLVPIAIRPCEGQRDVLTVAIIPESLGDLQSNMRGRGKQFRAGNGFVRATVSTRRSAPFAPGGAGGSIAIN
jgi:hypothetical protein